MSNFNDVVSSETTHFLAKNISINFGAIEALKNIDLQVNRGKVLGLVGDNGSGKSTLMKIISGVLAPSSGSIFLDGEEFEVHVPLDAMNLGIQTVFQDLALCENLDVTANLFLGYEETVSWAKFLPRFIRPLSFLEMEKKSKEALSKLNVRTLKSVHAKVESLSGGQRQAVAIARAIRVKSSVVLLDEPTAALGVAQTAQVLDVVKQLRDTNHAVIYISHNLRDIFEVCDDIFVLRHGAKVGVWETSKTTPDEIVVAMTHGNKE